MATITDITTGLQTVSAAGAVTGTLDISGMSGDFTVKVRVAALGAGKTAVIALEDTVNAFTAAVQQAVVQVRGEIKPEAEKVFSFHKRDLPNFRLGTASAACRLNVLSCTATPGLKVHAWLER
jgi:hypothetical protein